MRDNKRFGYGGEGQAAAYLQNRGYKILQTNFTCTYGELDIIAQDGDAVVFVEVKSRLSDKYGRPAEAVTKPKQRSISMAAATYIKLHRLFDREIRFDIIEILAGGLNHIEHAFYSTVKGI